MRAPRSAAARRSPSRMSRPLSITNATAKLAVVQCRNSSRKAWTRVVLRPTWRRDPAGWVTGSVMRYRPMRAPAKNALVGPVAGLRGEHPPDTTSRVGDVTPKAGNQMDVHVSDGLAGGRAIVDADIEGV